MFSSPHPHLMKEDRHKTVAQAAGRRKMSGSGAIRRKDWSEKEGARGTVPTAPLRSTHLGAKLSSCEIKKKRCSFRHRGVVYQWVSAQKARRPLAHATISARRRLNMAGLAAL